MKHNSQHYVSLLFLNLPCFKMNKMSVQFNSISGLFIHLICSGFNISGIKIGRRPKMEPGLRGIEYGPQKELVQMHSSLKVYVN